ncbi:MAG: hypothetical protein HYZ74_02785 [Elusimicrobia bacterium]|nr:hypothetical protein [Elusimicrobiota bacterium]
MPLNRDQRRPVYFAFQGLLMAVLILLYLYQGRQPGEHWVWRLLFLGDAAAASLILSLTQSGTNLFLIYVLILFGTALTRNSRQAMFVAGATVALYLLSGWRPRVGFPHQSEFWLRVLFLMVSTALLGILSRDIKRTQDEEKRRFDERLIQVERLATLGRIAAEVAHRIKGPLTTIAVDAEVLAHRHADDKKTLRELNQIREEVERCKEILKNLLDLGRIEEMDMANLDLRVPIERAARSIASQVKDKKARLTVTGVEGALSVRGDESMIQEALYCLLQNAVQSVERGGHVRLEVVSAKGWRRLSVCDDGAGVAPEDLEKIFQPFFTTKKDGSGLGLSAALRIAQKHGGTVEAESAGAGQGSRFTLVLPSV